MNDAPKPSSDKSMQHRQLLSLPTSNWDYVTALLKQGIPDDQVMASNNLWLRCGLTRILLGARYYTLREMEKT